MTTIWKLPLKIIDVQYIGIPKGSEILCVKVQNYNPSLWFLTNPSNQIEERTIEIFGTGNPIGDTCTRKYIGTIIIDHLVWHVFERIENII